MSQRQFLESKIGTTTHLAPEPVAREVCKRIEKISSRDVLRSIARYEFYGMSTEFLIQVSNIIDQVLAMDPNDLVKYEVPANPKNAKMAVVKQYVRRVNRLTGSSAKASTMEFIDSYTRLPDGKDALVYSYVIVLRNFCKKCQFSKTYNLIIDSDDVDEGTFKQFYRELIKHYQKEMSEKYQQLIGKIYYDECLETLTSTTKRALESIHEKLAEEKKNKEATKKESEKEATKKEAPKEQPQTLSDDDKIDDVIRKFMKTTKPRKTKGLNPNDYVFKNEYEYNYFVNLPLDLQQEYARRHLRYNHKAPKINTPETAQREAETTRNEAIRKYSIENICNLRVDTSFVC